MTATAVGRRLATTLTWPVLFGLACGGSPTSPSRAPGNPLPAPPPASSSARTTDALTGAAVSSVAVEVSGAPGGSSDTGGLFTITGSGRVPLILTKPGFVTRQTGVRLPSQETRISLLPDSFDLPAFNEMFNRAAALHRWRQPPALVIERSVLVFTSENNDAFDAGEARLSDDDVAALRADLEWALPQLTGNTFSTFASVTSQTAATGSSVPVRRFNTIVVARYEGLQNATTFWGYGRWAWDSSDAIVSGIIFLDHAFDRTPGPFRRSLRSHELGHALGYSHVTVNVSVMNTGARVEPNQFDRDAARIAFQRPPGNRLPDQDPGSYAVNDRTARSALSPGRVTWSPAVP